MSNDDMKFEYNVLREKIAYFAEINNLEERNKLVPRLVELSNLIDWGYEVGETVERRTTYMWVRDTIQAIRGNEFVFRSVTLPSQLIRKSTAEL